VAVGRDCANAAVEQTNSIREAIEVFMFVTLG